jgi:hypothetical protein
MTTGGGFSINTTSGVITADNRGTTTGTTRSSNSASATVTWTWTPTSGYNAGGTKSVSKGISATCSQAANSLESTNYSPHDAYASITIGNGITAGGGSATVSASAGHYAYDYYTSGSYNNNHQVTGDSYKVEEYSDPNSRFSYASGTLSHSSMGTYVGDDTCTLRCTNTSYSATKDASVSVSNQIEATKYGEGNSAWTATISTGSGISAAGGSATVSASAGHTHYWYQKYTSGSNTGYYTSAVTDTANVTEDSDPNNRFSYASGNLSHDSMGTYVGDDDCTLRVRNANNTATTDTASVSVNNKVENYDYNSSNSAYTATASIGSGMSAGGGSATVTYKAYHTHYYYYHYTSGSNSDRMSTTATDSAKIEITANGNSRFHMTTTTGTSETNTITLSHDSMGTNATTDSVTVKCTNLSSTSASGTDSKSIVNEVTSKAWNKPSVSLSYGTTIPAGGGTCAPSVSASQTGVATYTSTATASTSNTSFTYDYSMTASGRWTISSGTVSASTRGTTTGGAENSPTVTVTCTGAGSGTASTASTTAVATQALNTYWETDSGNTDYTASVSVASGSITAAGGSVTLSKSAGHTHYYKLTYSSGSVTPASGHHTTPVSDGCTLSLTTNGNSRYHLNGTTLSHDSMGTNVTTDNWVVKASNDAVPSVTASTSGSVSNSVDSYTEYGTPTGKSISGSQVPAAGGTSTITWSGTPSQTRKPVYTSTATGSSETFTPTISTAVTGNSAVGSKGTTISNATTAIATVTGYYWANGKTASTTCAVIQAGNYVTSFSEVEVLNKPTYGTIPAGGGTISPTLSQYALGGGFMNFSSGDYLEIPLDIPDIPSSIYGTLTTGATYSMSAGNGFTMTNTSTGTVSAETRGTTTGDTRYSNAPSVTYTITWTPTASYSAAGTITGSATESLNKVSQAANSVTRTDGNSAYTASVSIAANNLTAAGGSATLAPSASHTYWYYDTYTSGSRVPSSGAYTSSTSDSYTLSLTENTGSRFSINGTTLNHDSMGTNATTDYATVKIVGAGGSSGSVRTSGIVNQITTTDASPHSAYTQISIGSGIAASGGSATVSVSAGHWSYDRYTSGSENNEHNVTGDGYQVTETYDNNNRYSYASGTLTHSSMGTSQTTDTCTLKSTNTSHTATAETSVSVSNTVTGTTYDDPVVTASYSTAVSSAATSVNPTYSAWQKITYAYTSKATSSTTADTGFSWSITPTNAWTSDGGGIYHDSNAFVLTASTGAITAQRNPTTTARSSAGVTFTATKNSKSGSATVSRAQNGNAYTYLNTSSLAADSAGTTSGVYVYSNTSWSVTNANTALTFSSTSGSGSGPLGVTALANNAPTSRTLNFTVGSTTVTVTQAAGEWTGLYIQAIYDYSVPVEDTTFVEVVFDDNTFTGSLWYSTDKGATWTSMSASDGIDIGAATDNMVCFKGNNATGVRFDVIDQMGDTSIYYNVGGNIMSLINANNFQTLTTVPANAFPGMFEYRGVEDPYSTVAYLYLNDASELQLPGTTLGESCYSDMFAGQADMQNGPTMGNGGVINMGVSSCYEMFYATGLMTETPTFTIGSVTNDSCCAMFAQPAISEYDHYGYNGGGIQTINITFANDLQLAGGSLDYMFAGCPISEIRLPNLIPSGGDDTFGAHDMFYDCEDVAYVKFDITSSYGNPCSENSWWGGQLFYNLGYNINYSVGQAVYFEAPNDEMVSFWSGCVGNACGTLPSWVKVGPYIKLNDDVSKNSGAHGFNWGVSYTNSRVPGEYPFVRIEGTAPSGMLSSRPTVVNGSMTLTGDTTTFGGTGYTNALNFVLTANNGSSDRQISMNITAETRTTPATPFTRSKRVTGTRSITQSAATPTYNFSVRPTTVSLVSGSTNSTLTIVTNTSWSVTSNQSWCTLSRYSGSGSGTVTIYVTANTGGARNATLTFTVANIGERTVSVEQASAPSYNYTFYHYGLLGDDSECYTNGYQISSGNAAAVNFDNGLYSYADARLYGTHGINDREEACNLSMGSYYQTAETYTTYSSTESLNGDYIVFNGTVQQLPDCIGGGGYGGAGWILKIRVYTHGHRGSSNYLISEAYSSYAGSPSSSMMLEDQTYLSGTISPGEYDVEVGLVRWQQD